MVALPLFKLGALFLRHVSKYGANQIKIQAHDHPRFRSFAARYGQVIHQLNMRLSVASLRDVAAEIKAKELAETPTVKTKEQMEKEERAKAKAAAAGPASRFRSVWKRKFRPLPEAKAVDLFADVIGDAFILLIASALVIYEYHRAAQKPDANLERIQELDGHLEELRRREEELERQERMQASRILALEEALRNYKDPKTKLPLLPSPAPPEPAAASAT
ncbi:hypothetical protein MAPG_09684 [Magnaporthiopsis poae ATCC 64411]|uniref:OPA3 domain-containing protein n=1 Tax=Magnaporthiopsis poae (strain ATCC 64411 / 73-15) TaxID=644358 RepID=A0A0C4EAK9_MAGP6|nr:hypothetical protein MAPG_09684 [Magnaporthiopsis poae ATCC 64411]